MSERSERWEAVARLLKTEPLSNREIAGRLHVGTRFVAEVRADLGLPRFGRHLRVWTREDYERTTVQLRGGHRLWRGRRTANGSPITSRGETAYKLAYRLHHGREPVGRVGPVCIRKFCVEGAHLHDQALRDAAASAALTELPAGATWRGMDLVAIRRALRGPKPYPVLDEDEQRLAARFADPEMTTKELARRLNCAWRSANRWRSKGAPSCG